MNNIEKAFICLCVCEVATLHSMITATEIVLFSVNFQMERFTLIQGFLTYDSRGDISKNSARRCSMHEGV